MHIPSSAVVSVLAAGLFVSCKAPGSFERVTLKAGSPIDSTTGLKLISVEADGTAQIEWPTANTVNALRPNTATNQISVWTLDATEPDTQRARLSSQYRRSKEFRCWPYDPIQVVRSQNLEFTPEQFVQIARKHAQTEQVTTVEFGNALPLVYVWERPRPVLAMVHWGNGLGQPCLTVEIDHHGRVIRHVVATAQCVVTGRVLGK